MFFLFQLYSPHSHPNSSYSHPYSPHSHPDSSHSYPILHIPGIPTQIPYIPQISFLDSAFPLLQITNCHKSKISYKNWRSIISFFWKFGISVTKNFYWKQCFRAITWNKNHSSKLMYQWHTHSRKGFLQDQVYLDIRVSN